MTLGMRSAALLLVAALATSGCAVNGLSFVKDERVRIEQPAENAIVHLPARVQWTARNIEGPFGIFFDASPMRPGKTLIDLVPKNDPCRTLPTCPTVDWLSDRHVFISRQSYLDLETLPDLRPADRGVDRHSVTIVLLDATGRRVGESAFVREFIVHREGP